MNPTSLTKSEIKALDRIQYKLWLQSDISGWHPKRLTKTNSAVKLVLIHSEISEALEALRKKGKNKDTHLINRDALEVELADAMIRIFDMMQSLKYSSGRSIAEKNDYNSKRLDHKLSNRKKKGGKVF